jgi:hypothetical protein
MIDALLIFVLFLSLFLNFCLISRILCHDAEFYLDISDPENVKPILKFDIDEVENKPFFIVKVIKKENNSCNIKER